jgi:sulfite reductase beta subunit-like hemoprotein
MPIRIEDVKAEGLAIDIDHLAASGFESISEADRYRLKHQGVCAQRHVGVFMMRIRVPGGKASAAQLRRAAELADRYGNGSLHITTRGGLELHHVRIESVTAIWSALAEVGLTTKAACGDTLRNVITCPHAGTFAGEVLPMMPFVQLLHDRIVAISDETNISRKINIALACSPDCDAHVATSDIGFIAERDPLGGPPTFTVWGAGGLGATPRLAIELRRALPQTEILAAFDALVAIGSKFADRSSRAKAKMKIIIDKHGAGHFRELFEVEFAAAQARGSRSTVAFEVSSEEWSESQPAIARSAAAQKQPGRFTVPVLVPMGEISTEATLTLANAAERYGDCIVTLTPDQNAEIAYVADADVSALSAEIEAIGLRTRGRGSIADVVSCVGLEYCPLAVTHSMELGEALAQAFAPRLDKPQYRDFRIHVSGCPHSCAKHQVADIGLSGVLTEVAGERVEGYVLYLGGNAHERRLGVTFPTKIPRPMIFGVISAVLTEFDRHVFAGERFSQTMARTGSDTFFRAIAEVFDSVPRSLPSAAAS